MAVNLDRRVCRRCPISQHHIEPMQRQIGHQPLILIYMAQQPEVGLRQHRLKQTLHCQLGQAIKHTYCQPHPGLLPRIAHQPGQLLAQPKNLIGLPQRSLPRFGKRHPTPSRLEQCATQRPLELAHLRAHRLHRHAQPLGPARNTALVRYHPEVIQMAIAKTLAHRMPPLKNIMFLLNDLHSFSSFSRTSIGLSWPPYPSR